MAAFFIALGTGAMQAALLNGVLKNALANRWQKMLLFVLLKFVLYGGAVAVLFLLLREDIIKAAAGFAVGLPGAAVAATLMNLSKAKKGEDKGDNGSTH